MNEITFLRRKSPLAFTVMLNLLPILLLALGFPLLGIDFEDTGPRLIEELTKDPWQLLLLGGSGVAAVAIYPFQRRYENSARLFMDAQGIRFSSGLPAWLGRQLECDWPLSWNEVKGAILHPGVQRNAMELILTGRDGKRRRIRPEMWRASSDREKYIPLRPHRLTRDDLQAALIKHLLLRQVRAAGIPVEIAARPPTKVRGSDLTKVPEAMLAIGVLALLSLYGIVDGYILAPYISVDPLPWELLLGSGAIVAVSIGLLLRNTELSKLEVVVFAALVGVGGALAAYPGALRVNAATDEIGPRSRGFQLQEGSILKADDPQLPQIQAPLDREFWTNQTIGSRWEFRLYRGILGFWQYERKPILERIRAYHLEKNKRG
ncbi:MAG: hypothetical protein ACPW60_03035 [Methylohalobius sp. ZOD2]